MFIAHNGLSIFFNKVLTVDGDYCININVNIKGSDDKWHNNIGDMDVRLSDITRLCLNIEDLVK